MARFYFDIYNDDVTIDEEGIECADAVSARARAISEARILACDTIRHKGALNLEHRIVILDAAREPVAIVRFGDAVEIVG